MRVALILVGLGTLAVMELETPPRTTKPVNEPPAQATVGLRASHDTLTTADRLEIPHMQFEALQPSSEPMPPPHLTAIVAQEPSKIIEQHKRSASEEKSAVMLPRPRPRQETSKATANANRAKSIAEVKPCRSAAFEGLFKALNLSTGCQT
ncbi:type IV secretory pathway VirB10-like protein [Bradyrhizobium diazoefficiens]|jgi:hypothetical protein|uniref:hypothetical protein n=1 Tax=Bradyrhizobium diazoefficiens TaxID=1355477 RepID=UPI000BE9B049|nr:hypothetical protein [Bradyrhizobium diazoefficiens]PDT55820.1 hypothetical protein CO678_41760 [Bradyrhizobium diazoefficiens]BBZ96874.1 hypothetical protein F07S3_67070 [Bradyrhizobium diazoefficiens]BCA14560.1 hypothetical protein BDHF08_64070 [Bradyrhizobium diazoefficiens]BCE58970.1 hypothetical protein XF5B_64820 [Bradyrhizobium diazoefficiens]BCE67651.1 hypothetical protein XF6B_64500 [Bradyrhizobium diazoefficiens]